MVHQCVKVHDERESCRHPWFDLTQSDLQFAVDDLSENSLDIALAKLTFGEDNMSRAISLLR